MVKVYHRAGTRLRRPQIPAADPVPIFVWDKSVTGAGKGFPHSKHREDRVGQGMS